jgi:hypothetical protein
MPVIPALRRQRRDHEFEASLDYMCSKTMFEKRKKEEESKAKKKFYG